jgi:hypothetical protein
MYPAIHGCMNKTCHHRTLRTEPDVAGCAESKERDGWAPMPCHALHCHPLVCSSHGQQHLSRTDSKSHGLGNTTQIARTLLSPSPPPHSLPCASVDLRPPGGTALQPDESADCADMAWPGAQKGTRMTFLTPPRIAWPARDVCVPGNKEYSLAALAVFRLILQAVPALPGHIPTAPAI